MLDIQNNENRELIRQALLAYMKKNRIGVPILAKRIARHAKEEIDIKTLQRFLKGGIKTSDETIYSYSVFVEAFEKSDIRGALARAATAFYFPDSAETHSGVYDVQWTETQPHGLRATLRIVDGIAEEEYVDSSGNKHLYEGALVWRPPTGLILLRNKVSSAAKLYLATCMTSQQMTIGHTSYQLGLDAFDAVTVGFPVYFAAGEAAQ